MAKKLIPTPEELRQLLRYEPETGKLYWLKRPRQAFASQRSYNSWNSKHGGKEALTTITAEGYKSGTVLRTHQLAHRVAWAIHHGEWPTLQIDHINRDRNDNRIENLRDVSKRENARNMGRRWDNKSGCTGVSWCKREGKWTAYIRHHRQIHLGYTPRFCEAVKLRKAAERKYGFSALHGT